MSESRIRASEKSAAWLSRTGRSVAITGASGWVGQAVTHIALDAMGSADRLRLFSSRGGFVMVAGRSLPLEALRHAAPLGPGEWIVVHLAVAGADRIPDPHERRLRNQAMLADTLALAETGQVRRLVYASSGAVYAQAQADPDKQAYNDLKRDQEQAMQAWSAKAGVPLLVPRIFNLGGPYMNHLRRYALGDMILQALEGGVIRIQARKPVVRSYVHVLELARVIFDLALDAAPAITFDTAGAKVVEMGDLAASVGAALGLPQVKIERAALDAEAGPDRYVGDGRLYRSALGAQPMGLAAIIRDTADWIRRSAPSGAADGPAGPAPSRTGVA